VSPTTVVAPFQQFLDTLKKASNETQTREAFVVLAATGFDEDGSFATELALGAEYQVRFEKTGLIRRGAIDSFYGNLIIEFEHDLTKTGAHALDQLRTYVAGAWREDGGPSRSYLAVVSDGARWEVYAARPVEPEAAMEPRNVHLETSESWPVSGEQANAVSLRDFLNRLFFRKRLLKPTAANFARDFGLGSPAYLAASTELGLRLAEFAHDPQVKVLRQCWSDSLQISYGSVATDDELFVKHTYLAVLARLLLWAALEHRQLSTGELQDVLDGTYFKGARRIANLAEYDFFQWHALKGATVVERAWLGLARHLSGYDLTGIREDILKPLYEDLVDPAFRHDLGEFYTPDWLASMITERILRDWDWAAGVPAVLDPACGSGTFLRVAIELIRERSGLTDNDLLEEVLGKVVGVDVHPLAVTISKATYLLAMKDLVPQSHRPITLPVFLANSLRTPPRKETASLLAETTEVDVGGRKFDLPVDFVRHGRDFDEAIDDVLAVGQAFARSSSSQAAGAPTAFAARVAKRYDHYQDPETLVATLGKMAQHFARLIKGSKDSIHGYMLKNHHRLAMLGQSFDVVVGNPPWLTVSAIATESYKDRVIQLAIDSSIAPRATGVLAHTELATLFLPQASTEFLNERTGKEARIGLVMPRSVFTATQHRLLREGKYTALFDVVEIWDLAGVHPLFNVPACVLFAARRNPRPTQRKPGQVLVGVLPRKDVPLSQATSSLQVTPATFQLKYLGKRSAWTTGGEDGTTSTAVRTQVNPYKAAFRQGAILYPQTLLVVRTPTGVSRASGVVPVAPDPAAAKLAKLLPNLRFRKLVNAENLYLTAAAEHIFPYTLSPELWTVVLPTLNDPGNSAFRPCSADGLRQQGRVETADWLDFAEKQWAKARKKGDTTPLSDRLDYLGQFRAQSEQRRFVVLYTASAGRPYATVLDRDKLPLPFVARDKTYWASFRTAKEAHFLAAFLNSEFVAGAIADWMTTGLLGPRDIHTRPLDVPWPRFDPRDEMHERLVDISKGLSTIARTQLEGGTLRPASIGRARVWLRNRLPSDDLEAVEVLVAHLSSTA